MGKAACIPESRFNRFRHQILNHIPENANGLGQIIDDLAVTAIHTEGDQNLLLFVPAYNLKTVGTPPHVTVFHDDWAVTSTDGFTRIPDQKQPVHLHSAVNPLGVDPGRPSSFFYRLRSALTLL